MKLLYLVAAVGTGAASALDLSSNDLPWSYSWPLTKGSALAPDASSQLNPRATQRLFHGRDDHSSTVTDDETSTSVFTVFSTRTHSAPSTSSSDPSTANGPISQSTIQTATQNESAITTSSSSSATQTVVIDDSANAIAASSSAGAKVGIGVGLGLGLPILALLVYCAYLLTLRHRAMLALGRPDSPSPEATITHEPAKLASFLGGAGRRRRGVSELDSRAVTHLYGNTTGELYAPHSVRHEIYGMEGWGMAGSRDSGRYGPLSQEANELE